MTETNARVVLAARPVGFPRETDFRLEEAPVPEPGEGEILVRSRYLSLDPYMRGRMNEARSYADPAELGEVMAGGAVGTVVESKHPQFSEGDDVLGMWGWQDYALSDGAGVQKVDTGLAPAAGRGRRREVGAR